MNILQVTNVTLCFIDVMKVTPIASFLIIPIDNTEGFIQRLNFIIRTNA